MLIAHDKCARDRLTNFFNEEQSSELRPKLICPAPNFNLHLSTWPQTTVTPLLDYLEQNSLRSKKNAKSDVQQLL